MEIRHAYRDNKELRDSFNELAGKVFGLNFEGWYQNGYWKDAYDPYSVIIDGKVVSNVSVNRCDMNYKDRVVHLIQLGTVMTDPGFRGKGYSRLLMERVLKDNEGADGIYLYGSDSVVEFYPRFGFKESREYCYSKDVAIDSERTAEAVVRAGILQGKDRRRFRKSQRGCAEAFPDRQRAPGGRQGREDHLRDPVQQQGENSC